MAAPEAEGGSKSASETGGGASTKGAKRKRARAGASKSRKRRSPRAKASSAKKTAKRAPRKSSRTRRYTPADRARILAEAQRQGLSGPAAAKKFGISQLTYYTWRKKSRSSATKAEAAGAAVGRTLAGAVNLSEMIRDELRKRIHELLPGTIREEVGRAIGQTRRRRR